MGFREHVPVIVEAMLNSIFIHVAVAIALAYDFETVPFLVLEKCQSIVGHGRSFILLNLLVSAEEL